MNTLLEVVHRPDLFSPIHSTTAVTGSMDTIIPAELTFASVVTNVSDLLSNTFVLAAIAATIALALMPRLVRLVKGVFRGR